MRWELRHAFGIAALCGVAWVAGHGTPSAHAQNKLDPSKGVQVTCPSKHSLVVDASGGVDACSGDEPVSCGGGTLLQHVTDAEGTKDKCKGGTISVDAQCPSGWQRTNKPGVDRCTSTAPLQCPKNLAPAHRSGRDGCGVPVTCATGMLVTDADGNGDACMGANAKCGTGRELASEWGAVLDTCTPVAGHPMPSTSSASTCTPGYTRKIKAGPDACVSEEPVRCPDKTMVRVKQQGTDVCTPK